MVTRSCCARNAPNDVPVRHGCGMELVPDERDGALIAWLTAAVIGLSLHPAHKPEHRYPSWWLEQAHCIHYQETHHSWGSGWHISTVYGTGQPSSQRGGFQINVATWASFAPAHWTRDPAQARRNQQVLVAWRIWRHNGDSWGANDQWPGTAAACGVR